MCLKCLQTRGRGPLQTLFRHSRSPLFTQNLAESWSGILLIRLILYRYTCSRSSLRRCSREHLLSTHISDLSPRSPSSCCGTSGRAPASCFYPRRVSSHHGAGQCDPRPLPSCTVLLSCTGRTAGAPEGISSLSSATLNHILGQPRIGSPPDASAYASHSTSSRRGQAHRSRDDGRACSACSASAHPSFSLLPRIFIINSQISSISSCLVISSSAMRVNSVFSAPTISFVLTTGYSFHR